MARPSPRMVHPTAGMVRRITTTDEEEYGFVQIGDVVGNLLQGTASAAALASSGNPGNVASVLLPAGTWWLSGWFVVDAGSTGLTSGSTLQLTLGSLSATNGTEGVNMTQESVLALLANGKFSIAIPGIQVTPTVATTYYAVMQATYIGSPTASGIISGILLP